MKFSIDSYYNEKSKLETLLKWIDKERKIANKKALMQDLPDFFIENPTEDQRMVLKYIMSWCKHVVKNKGVPKKPLRVMIFGGPGSGKTTTIKAMDTIFRYMRNGKFNQLRMLPNGQIIKLPDSEFKEETEIEGLARFGVLRAGTTGYNCHNHGGVPIQQLFALPDVKKNFYEIPEEVKVYLQNKLLNHEILILDEISMCGKRMLGWISRDMQILFRDDTDALANKSVIFVGDLGIFNYVLIHTCISFCTAQITPVGDMPIFAPLEREIADVEKLGGKIWLSFKRSFFLNENITFANLEFKDFIHRMHNGECRKDDYDNILLPMFGRWKEYYDKKEWKEAHCVVFTSEEKFIHNEKLLNMSGKKIYRIDSVNEPCLMKKYPATVMGGLLNSLRVCKNTKVMLCARKFVNCGTFNGAIARVRDIIYSPNCDPLSYDLPLCVMVKFSGYDGPSPFGDGVIPITPVKININANIEGRMSISRKQIPLCLASAMSIYKIQGKSVDKIIVDIDKYDRIEYILLALTRVYKRENILLKPFSKRKWNALVCSCKDPESMFQLMLKEEERLRGKNNVIISRITFASIVGFRKLTFK